MADYSNKINLISYQDVTEHIQAMSFISKE